MRFLTLSLMMNGIYCITGLINLRDLEVDNNRISDISPYRGLKNLVSTSFRDNMVSDISPLAQLVNLDYLAFTNNNVSDLSPLAGLINLKRLNFLNNDASDLSPLAGLINLTNLDVAGNNISDLAPIAGLINLGSLEFSGSNVSDLSPLAGLVNLQRIRSWGHSIFDISPLAGLTRLERVDFCGGHISDLTPLAGLTGLKELYLASEEISDISPLARLTGLTRLSLTRNDISDISPLAGLTQLKWLEIYDNEISDFSPLDGLRKNITLIWHNNPGFPKGGPKIEGPWLWAVLLDTKLDSSTDLLSEASRGTMTEVGIATHGAIEGRAVGDDVWTIRKLPPTGKNILEMLQGATPDGVIYGSVSLHSPREQSTTMYVGSDYTLKVWLNGTLMYERLKDLGPGNDYEEFFPVTLKSGRNVLLVAVHIINSERSAFFGFEPGTEYTVANPGISYTFSKTPIYIDDTFTLDISAENVFDMAGWQFDIAFDPTLLDAINVSEGDFLKTGGGTTFFQGGTIDNAVGKITGLSAARLSTQGMSGTGTLLQVRFKAKSAGETKLALQNFEFGATTGDLIPAGPHQIRIVVEGQLATGDVNRDGRVSILDLILIAQQLGKRVPANSPVDLNRDGVVSILDLILAAQGLGTTTASAAPVVATENVNPAMIAAWIAQARLEDDGSHPFKQGIENLEKLLASLIPKETVLLANYPNPFNPETWIPYQLAESAEVTLTIYDINGEMVRRLALDIKQRVCIGVAAVRCIGTDGISSVSLSPVVSISTRSQSVPRPGRMSSQRRDEC